MPHLTGEPLSYHLYIGDGAQTDFTFAKGYLAQSHVYVTIDEVAQTAGRPAEPVPQKILSSYSGRSPPSVGTPLGSRRRSGIHVS